MAASFPTTWPRMADLIFARLAYAYAFLLSTLEMLCFSGHLAAAPKPVCGCKTTVHQIRALYYFVLSGHCLECCAMAFVTSRLDVPKPRWRGSDSCDGKPPSPSPTALCLLALTLPQRSQALLSPRFLRTSASPRPKAALAWFRLLRGQPPKPVSHASMPPRFPLPQRSQILLWSFSAVPPHLRVSASKSRA